MDLGEPKNISYLQIAWFKGNRRVYDYEITLFNDKKYDKEGIDKTLQTTPLKKSEGSLFPETIHIDGNVKARYVRITGTWKYCQQLGEHYFDWRFWITLRTITFLEGFKPILLDNSSQSRSARSHVSCISWLGAAEKHTLTLGPMQMISLKWYHPWRIKYPHTMEKDILLITNIVLVAKDHIQPKIASSIDCSNRLSKSSGVYSIS